MHIGKASAGLSARALAVNPSTWSEYDPHQEIVLNTLMQNKK
jgi:hypothetical protein